MRTWLSVLLAAFSLVCCGGLLVLSYQQQGYSALLLVNMLLCAAALGWLLQQFHRQFHQPIQMFRALANGDHTLGLPNSHPLRQSFDAARQRLQQARLDAEAKAQFLRHVLLHTELAMLIYQEDGQIIEQSPAAARLLGIRIEQVQQLGAQASALLLGAKHPQQSTLSWWRGDQADTFGVLLSPVQIAGQALCMATLQSIHQPLNQREQEAYSKLTRVLTHEIANSITPLASIADSCVHLLPQDLSFDSIDDKNDLQLGLSTLSKRTQHLVAFIDNFRRIASVPRPTLILAPLMDVVQQVALLYQQQCGQKGIVLHIELHDPRPVAHDPVQLEQVLINLVKNAIDALEQLSRANDATSADIDPPRIVITLAALSEQQVMIEVRDNGPGITEDTANMMFVPFFTTKASGSGIGLPLARQIMRQHQGDLIHVPTANGACFRLVLA